MTQGSPETAHSHTWLLWNQEPEQPYIIKEIKSVTFRPTLFSCLLCFSLILLLSLFLRQGLILWLEAGVHYLDEADVELTEIYLPLLGLKECSIPPWSHKTFNITNIIYTQSFPENGKIGTTPFLILWHQNFYFRKENIYTKKEKETKNFLWIERKHILKNY